MGEQVFFKDIAFDKAESEIRTILADVDRGTYDDELSKAGAPRPPETNLGAELRIAQKQGLSPDQWWQLIADFAPVAAAIAKDVWTIVVVPRLKRKFRSDRVSPDDPSRNR